MIPQIDTQTKRDEVKRAETQNALVNFFCAITLLRESTNTILASGKKVIQHEDKQFTLNFIKRMSGKEESLIKRLEEDEEHLIRYVNNLEAIDTLLSQLPTLDPVHITVLGLLAPYLKDYNPEQGDTINPRPLFEKAQRDEVVRALVKHLPQATEKDLKAYTLTHEAQAYCVIGGTKTLNSPVINAIAVEGKKGKTQLLFQDMKFDQLLKLNNYIYDNIINKPQQ